MAQLRQDFELFKALDTAILVIGPDSARAFSRYWLLNQLPFIGLPDPRHNILKQYGQEIKIIKWGRMPAMVIIDKAGQVRFVHYGLDMADIPENQVVLETIRDLGR